MVTNIRVVWLVVSIIGATLIALSSSAEEREKPEDKSPPAFPYEAIDQARACSLIRNKAKSGEQIADSEKKVIIRCTLIEDTLKESQKFYQGNIPQEKTSENCIKRADGIIECHG
jgi:hypothetical protein